MSTLSRYTKLLTAHCCSSHHKFVFNKVFQSSCRINHDYAEKWKTMSFDERSATGFENTRTRKLLRAAFVLKLSSNNYIAANAISLMHKTKDLVGKRFFRFLMNLSFYGHFCIGEEKRDIEITTRNLLQNNIRPMILVTIEEESRDSTGNETDELLWFANNKDVILDCLNICSETEQGKAPKYIHFRLSALLPSKVLTKVSKKLSELRNDPHQLDPVADVTNFKELLADNGFEKFLNEEECKQLYSGLKHVEEVGRTANEKGIRVLVDAEYISFNPAIRVITHIMMLKFNRHMPTLQHTFQAYLKCSIAEAEKCMEFCRKENIHFGAKIVRGAYMSMERELAALSGAVDPIYENKDATNISYDSIVANIIGKIKAGEASTIQLMIACHNMESINKAIIAMKKNSIDPQRGSVIFGQTYGFSDYITNWLGQNDFLVYKSTPVGSIDDTLPYLHRRAQENKAALDFRMDKVLISRELRKRLNLVKRQSLPLTK